MAGIALAEWTKLRTLRSSYWTLLAAAAAMAGFGALLCAAYARHLTAASRAALDPAAYSESGFFLAQLAIGVLGVLTVLAAPYRRCRQAALPGGQQVPGYRRSAPSPLAC